MCKVIVAGGGWSGCSAAVEAAKLGATVTLLERTDMLLGTGLVGGIMRNNGRYTATEEMIAMGGGDLFSVIEQNLKHKNVDFPGHKHADLYNIATLSSAVEKYLIHHGVKVVLNSRLINAEVENNRIISVKTADGTDYSGDMFIDTTGTAGPMNNCGRYGNGCAMCILRCPSFGGRISLSALEGVSELTGMRESGAIGSMSGSCKLLKESLSDEIRQTLDQKGVCVITVPEQLQEDHLSIKCCQQYALPAFKEHIVLLDTGHAKMMAPFYTLSVLHEVPGLEHARYEDPYAGGRGNSMRYFAMAPRKNTLEVQGIENLFCAGEKSGLIVGHTEAIVTGVLAGYNSLCKCRGIDMLTLPETTAIGDLIATVGRAMKSEEGRKKKYTFSGSVFFKQMQEKGLYSTDREEIKKRIKSLGLEKVFAS